MKNEKAIGKQSSIPIDHDHDRPSVELPHGTFIGIKRSKVSDQNNTYIPYDVVLLKIGPEGADVRYLAKEQPLEFAAAELKSAAKTLVATI